MAKGYWVVHMTVLEKDGYRAYVREAQPFLAERGARFLVVGGRYEAVEGSAAPRHILVEFDSFDAAREAYHSPEYARIRKLREGACEADVLVVEGFSA
ncbi:MAG: DUF1330 domain-containing protein [Flavobacteriaceae bacterium]